MGKTLTAWLENVFGRYYEWKSNLLDYDYIPMSYGVDWNLFIEDFKTCRDKRQDFNGICPVLYIRATFSGTDKDKETVIERVSIRPCAFGHPFLNKCYAC